MIFSFIIINFIFFQSSSNLIYFEQNLKLNKISLNSKNVDSTSHIHCALNCFTESFCVRFTFTQNKCFLHKLSPFLPSKLLISSSSVEYRLKSLCQKNFQYEVELGKCLKVMEKSTSSWKMVREMCNKLGPGVHPPIIPNYSTASIISKHIKTLIAKRIVFLKSYSIWTCGQRHDPSLSTSPFFWKPFPNSSTHFPVQRILPWSSGEPSGIYKNKVEGCIVLFWNKARVNDAFCFFKGGVVCVSDIIADI